MRRTGSKPCSSPLQNGEVRRSVVFLLAALVAVATCGAAAAAASPASERAAAAITVPEVIASTTAAPPGEALQGTSPWALVLIGAVAGGTVGVFTGLARRKHAKAGR
jgi:hypothetical protein